MPHLDAINSLGINPRLFPRRLASCFSGSSLRLSGSTTSREELELNERIESGERRASLVAVAACAASMHCNRLLHGFRN